MRNADSDYPWRNTDDIIKAVDINSLQSINGVLRNTDDSSSPIVKRLQII